MEGTGTSSPTDSKAGVSATGANTSTGTPRFSRKRHEAVQRERHAVLDVIVVAREQGHPQFGVGRPCHVIHARAQAATLSALSGGTLFITSIGIVADDSSCSSLP